MAVFSLTRRPRGVWHLTTPAALPLLPNDIILKPRKNLIRRLPLLSSRSDTSDDVDVLCHTFASHRNFFLPLPTIAISLPNERARFLTRKIFGPFNHALISISGRYLRFSYLRWGRGIISVTRWHAWPVGRPLFPLQLNLVAASHVKLKK
jgi:hypothetical protein